MPEKSPAPRLTAKSISARFVTEGGRPRLPASQFEAVRAALLKLPAGERRTVGLELLALALRLVQTSRETTREAVEQLSLLATAGLDCTDAVEVLLGRAADPTRAAPSPLAPASAPGATVAAPVRRRTPGLVAPAPLQPRRGLTRSAEGPAFAAS